MTKPDPWEGFSRQAKLGETSPEAGPTFGPLTVGMLGGKRSVYFTNNSKQCSSLSRHEYLLLWALARAGSERPLTAHELASLVYRGSHPPAFADASVRGALLLVRKILDELEGGAHGVTITLDNRHGYKLAHAGSPRHVEE